MPRFEPFAGLRFVPARVGASLDAVSCPPYDSLTPPVRRSLLARSPFNVVRLELAGETRDGQDPGAEGRAVLEQWRSEGVLVRDPAPAFYGYRTTTPAGSAGPHQTVGFIGALGLEEPGTGVLPHEETTEGFSAEHRRRLEALRVNVSPIWALALARGLSELAEPVPGDGRGAPTGGGGVSRARDEDGVLHELWPVVDPDRVAAIRELVGSEPLVLADGHHRYETALAYHHARLAAGRPSGTGSGALMAWVVELSGEQLRVQAIHRLVHTADPAKLLQALHRHFALLPTRPVDPTITGRMDGAQALGVVTPTGTWLARPGTATAVAEDLDARRLDRALAEVPGLAVTYQAGWEAAAAAVTAGHADAAILLRPPTVHQIAAISRAGTRMPAKTTFFWPKPRTGLVLRELDP